MNRLRLMVGVAIPVILALALVAVLLMSNRDNKGGLAISGNRQSTTISPSSIMVTTTQGPPRILPLDNQGEDFDQIIRSLVDRWNWLQQNPNAQLVSQIAERECPCYPIISRQLQELSEKRWRHSSEDSGLQILSVKVFNRGKDIVSLEVRERRMAEIILDEEGHVIRRGENQTARLRYYLLRRGEDNRWRFLFIRGMTQ